jgi:hypothetical protein
LNTPLFQLIRRINNRRSRANSNTASATPVTASTESTNDTNQDSSDSWSNLIRESENAAINSVNYNGSHGIHMSNLPRSRTSFHYRLRRHVNPHSGLSVNGINTGATGQSGGSNAGPSRIPLHRHRFQRSPTSRFHFNFLDDDELLNDHGAIIITTVILLIRFDLCFKYVIFSF